MKLLRVQNLFQGRQFFISCLLGGSTMFSLAEIWPIWQR